MKVTHYHLSGPVKGLWKQHAIVGREKNKLAPLVYLQRPKWIKDDEVWRKIVGSVQLRLRRNLEVK